MLAGALVALLALLGGSSAAEHKVLLFSTTDVHGYVYGHISDPGVYIDFGDYRRFIDCMSEAKSDETLLVFDSGDLIQGTGLSDFTDPPGIYIYEVYNMFGFDGVTIGNHDAGEPTSMDWIVEKGYDDMFISGNVFYNKNGFTDINSCSYANSTLLGNPYRIIQKDGMVILVLGFLYGSAVEDSVCNLQLHEEEEQDGTTSSFFETIYWTRAQEDINNLTGGSEPDLIVTLNHIPSYSSSYDYQQVDIYSQVRNVYANTTLVMLNGHTHQNRKGKCSSSSALESVASSDNNCLYIEASCYMNLFYKLELTLNDGALSSYDTWYYYAEYDVLEDACPGFTSIESDVATQLDNFIYEKVDELELLKVVGYSNYFYDMNLKPSYENSLWRLYTSSAVPLKLYSTMIENGTDKEMPEGEWMFFSNSGSLRDDLYEGEILNETISNILPFKNNFRYMVPAVTGEQLKEIYYDINSEYDEESEEIDYMPLPILPTEIVDDNKYVIISTDYIYYKVDDALDYLGIELDQTWVDIQNVPNMMEVLELYIQDEFVQSVLENNSVTVEETKQVNFNSYENENVAYLTLMVIFCAATIIAQIVAGKGIKK